MKNTKDGNNYVFLCWLVNVIGSASFLINPLFVFTIYVFLFILAYKIPDIFLEPFEITDLILYSFNTFIFCLSCLFLLDYFDFSRLKAVMLCMPIAIVKEAWFYLTYTSLTNR